MLQIYPKSWFWLFRNTRLNELMGTITKLSYGYKFGPQCGIFVEMYVAYS